MQRLPEAIALASLSESQLFPTENDSKDDAEPPANRGNMTTMPAADVSPVNLRTLKYDAWNRLVEIRASNNNNKRMQVNQYDGLNRRIVKDRYDKLTDLLIDSRHFYYNQQWQVLEERVGTSTTANKQFVYHPYYVDAIAIRRDASGNDHYYLQDANFNVTAVVDNTGAVEERYSYTPYGEVTILDLDFSAVSGNVSAISNEHLYTGRRLDPETGLQLNRNRFYAAGLGRWVNRDPIGYAGGGMNVYEYVGGRALMGLDSQGTRACTPAERMFVMGLCHGNCKGQGKLWDGTLTRCTCITIGLIDPVTICKGKCGCRGAPKNCGTCTAQKLVLLQATKDAACLGAGKPRPGMSCEKLLHLAIVNGRCHWARKAVQLECFKGKTDKVHQGLIDEHRKRADDAWKYYFRKSCGPPLV